MEPLEKKFTRGNREHTKVSYDEMIDVIAKYIAESPNSEYDITIGTDSQNHKMTRIVEVLAICRVGDGGKFFYFREDIARINNLKEKIIEETNRSITNATGFIDKLAEKLIDYDVDLYDMFDKEKLGFAVHADIGRRGKTKDLIKEICAWIEAAGFEARIKPDSYAASGVANMLSK